MHKLKKFLRIKSKETAENPLTIEHLFVKFKVLLKHHSWKNNVFLNLNFSVIPLLFYNKMLKFKHTKALIKNKSYFLIPRDA